MTCPRCRAAPMRRYPFAKGSEDPGWRCLWRCEGCGHCEAEPEPVKVKAITGGLFEDEETT